MEEITQDDVEALRSEINKLRSLERLERVASIGVAINEKARIAEERYSAAVNRANEAEARAVAREEDAARRYNAAEDRIGQQRRDHADEMRRFANDEAAAEEGAIARLREKKAAIEISEVAATREHNERMDALTAKEQEKRLILVELEVKISDQQALIASLEAKKAQMEAEFANFFKK